LLKELQTAADKIGDDYGSYNAKSSQDQT